MNLCCDLNSTKEVRFHTVIDLHLKQIVRDASLNNDHPIAPFLRKEKAQIKLIGEMNRKEAMFCHVRQFYVRRAAP